MKIRSLSGIAALLMAFLVGLGGCTLPTFDLFGITNSQEVRPAASFSGIKGVLVAADGTPVPAFEITVLETGSKTTTAGDGSFSLPLDAGTYSLFVTTDYSSALTSSEYFSPRKVVLGTKGVDLGSWTASTPSTLGRTINIDTPYFGVHVTIAALSSPTTVLADAISSSDEGMFPFFGLADGEYVVKGSGAGVTLTSTQVQVVTEVHNGVSVQVTHVWNGSAYSAYAHYGSDNWTVSGTPTLQAMTNGVISGNVSLNASPYTPFSGFTVNLLDGSGVLVATTTTDVNGNYSFTALAYTTGSGPGSGTPYTVELPAQATYAASSLSVTLNSASSTMNDFFL